MTRLALLFLLGVGGLAIYHYTVGELGSSATNDAVPSAVARRTTLADKVVEQGVIESQKTVNGICETKGHENKIIFLAPEGSLVKEGEVVVKFDDAKIKEEISEGKVQVNEAKTAVETAKQELKVQEDENETAIRSAEQTLTFADLDLKKYVEGDYKVKKSEIEQGISEAQTDVDQANRDMQNTRALVKRGFREYQQLEEAKQVVKSANLKLINAKQKLTSLEKFEHVKSLAEFEGKAVDAKKALATAKTTAKAKFSKAQDALKNAKAGLKLREARLKDKMDDLEKHHMKAPQAGTFTLARNDWRGNGEKLHQGAIVYQNQPVFILPDMTRMQVKVGIHETLVSKVKVGQKATIKIDAFAGVTLGGVVKSISQMSASTRWERSNNYTVFVTIDSFPDDLTLKPGMNAEVEIYAGRYEDRLAVPIQSVTSFGSKRFVFKQNAAGKFESQEVETEKSTISFVAVTSGLNEGDVVALDAYQRGLSEFDENDTEKMLQLEMDEMAKADSTEGASDGDTVSAPADSDEGKSAGAGLTSEESGTNEKTDGEAEKVKESAPADVEEPSDQQEETKSETKTGAKKEAKAKSEKSEVLEEAPVIDSVPDTTPLDAKKDEKKEPPSGETLPAIEETPQDVELNGPISGLQSSNFQHDILQSGFEQHV